MVIITFVITNRLSNSTCTAVTFLATKKVEKMLILLTFVLMFLSLLYVYFQKQYTFWTRKGVVQIPPSFPFGNFGYFILRTKTINEVMVEQDHLTKGLPYYGQYFLCFPNFVVKDVELVRQILVKDFYHFFQDRDPTLAIHLGKSEHQADIINRKRLTNARGSEWKNLRTTLSPLFTAGKMKAMIPFMQETCQQLIEVT